MPHVLTKREFWRTRPDQNVQRQSSASSAVSTVPVATMSAARREEKRGVSDAQGDRDSNAGCIKRSVINDDDNNKQQKRNKVDR